VVGSSANWVQLGHFVFIFTFLKLSADSDHNHYVARHSNGLFNTEVTVEILS